MKNNIVKIFSLYFLFTCFFLTPLSGDQEEKTKSFQLENGLKIYLYEKHTLPITHLVFAVNLGSKDETEETNGLVHILEHYILFRGSEFRDRVKISQDIRRHGAYYNAHTGHDLALFEISLPSEYTEFALKHQKDVMFNLKLTQEELDEEKQVILEELSQIEDDPVKQATSLAYQNLFGAHPYSRPIYGTRETIEAATVEQMEIFCKNFIVPSNCSLALVGDFSIEKMEETIKNIFGEVVKKPFTPREIKKSIPLKKTVEVKHEMDVNMAYLVIGLHAPDYNHPDQFALDVLTEILGRGVNPMLNSALRGRRYLANSIRMGYSSYRFGGAVIIIITTEPKNIKSARREAIKFLKNTRKLNYSKKDYFGSEQLYAFDYLEGAKNRIKFNVHRAQEQGLLIASSLARYLLLQKNEESGDYLESIFKIKSSRLREVAGKYLGKGDYAIVSILPKKKK